MQKIGDIPNTRADINGEFTDGNVAGGVPPTILPAEWFNTIQRELMSVLSAAEIDADSAQFNQVLLSIQKLIGEGIPDIKDASLTQKGIVQLSNATNSTSETLAATPKAVRAVDIAALKIANNLSEIKDTGLAAVAQTLLNLGLGDAAKRTIGTGNNNVPDIAMADARYKPLSYIPPLSQVWLSSEYTPVLNTPTIVSHGLTIPDPLKCKADVILKCIVANNGYAVGETAIGMSIWTQSARSVPPIPLLTNSQIQINTGSQGVGGLLMMQKSSGGNEIAVDPAQWRYIFRIIY